jgi:predicted small metal-binding protein
MRPEDAGSVHLVVRCECGFEVRGAEEELVPAVQEHGLEAHNMRVTREQVLAMARPA